MNIYSSKRILDNNLYINTSFIKNKSGKNNLNYLSTDSNLKKYNITNSLSNIKIQNNTKSHIYSKKIYPIYHSFNKISNYAYSESNLNKDIRYQNIKKTSKNLQIKLDKLISHSKEKNFENERYRILRQQYLDKPLSTQRQSSLDIKENLINKKILQNNKLLNVSAKDLNILYNQYSSFSNRNSNSISKDYSNTNISFSRNYDKKPFISFNSPKKKTVYQTFISKRGYYLNNNSNLDDKNESLIQEKIKNHEFLRSNTDYLSPQNRKFLDNLRKSPLNKNNIKINDNINNKIEDDNDNKNDSHELSHLAEDLIEAFNLNNKKNLKEKKKIIKEKQENKKDDYFKFQDKLKFIQVTKENKNNIDEKTNNSKILSNESSPKINNVFNSDNFELKKNTCNIKNEIDILKTNYDLDFNNFKPFDEKLKIDELIAENDKDNNDLLNLKKQLNENSRKNSFENTQDFTKKSEPIFNPIQSVISEVSENKEFSVYNENELSSKNPFQNSNSIINNNENQKSDFYKNSNTKENSLNSENTTLKNNNNDKKIERFQKKIVKNPFINNKFECKNENIIENSSKETNICKKEEKEEKINQNLNSDINSQNIYTNKISSLSKIPKSIHQKEIRENSLNEKDKNINPFLNNKFITEKKIQLNGIKKYNEPIKNNIKEEDKELEYYLNDSDLINSYI
jgi:hypothetical protein